MTNIASVELWAGSLASLAWTQLWQVTVVVMLVAALARWGCRRRPHLAYLLWMLVVVKALTPPLVASRAGIFSWTLRSEAPPVVAVAPVPPVERFAAPIPPRFDPSRLAINVPAEPAPRVAPVVPAAEPETKKLLAAVSPGMVIVTVWLLGVICLATYVIAKWIGCRRRWRAVAVEVPATLEQRVSEVATRLGLRSRIRRRLRILVTREATSPAVFGIWRATLLLPADLFALEDNRDNTSRAANKTLSLPERGQGEGTAPSDPAATNKHLAPSSASETQLDAILAHELIHIRRGDPAAALLQLLAQLLWWFHPLVWWANREARRERERACDEEVVAGLGCRPADYARALLDVLERQSRAQPAFAVPGVGMLGVTARRLDHLLRHADQFQKRTPWPYYGAALVMLALILPGAGLQTVAAPTEAGEQQETPIAAEQNKSLSLPGRGQGEGAGAAASSETSAADDSPSPRLSSDGRAEDEQNSDAAVEESATKPAPAEPTIIVAEHVILWDNRIVTWEQMVLRFRTMRADGPIHPHFKFTNGAYQNGVEERFHKRLFDIYKELFEPEGMSLGNMTPRAGTRLDRIRTEDDLRRDRAREHKGQVLTADGKPAAGAQVVVLPLNDPSGVVLAGTQLRDPYDQEWTSVDAEGRYTIYPENDEYVLAILHPSGCDIRPGPAKDEPPTIELVAWATVTFTSTGGIKEQSGDLRSHAAALGPDSIDFIVFQVQVDKEAVTVPIPPGQVQVSRSLKMDEGSSVSLPVEQIDLAAGENHDAALGPPTAADRAKADEVHRPMRERREESKRRREEELEQEKQAATGNDTEQKNNVEPKDDVKQKPLSLSGRGQGEGAAGGGSQRLRFTPDQGQGDTAASDVTPDANSRSESPAKAADAEQAFTRLRELGLDISGANNNRDTSPTGPLTVVLHRGWKGKPDDLKLLSQLPNVKFIHAMLDQADGKALSQIVLEKPLDVLILQNATDERLENITRLPKCRSLNVDACDLSADGCRRLVELAPEITSMQVSGPLSGPRGKMPPKGISDDGLKFIGQLRGLTSLDLLMVDITDAGLEHLAGLERLKSLAIVDCPRVHGAGLGKLRSLPALRDLVARIPIDAQGIQGVAELTQLESLMMPADNVGAADFAPLAKLVNLRSLSVFCEKPAASQPNTGNGILKAAGAMPELRSLVVQGLAATSQGIAALAGARNLQSLIMNPLELGDASLEALARLSELRRITATASGPVSDAGLAQLAKLENLNTLEIYDAGTTDAGLRELTRLPALESLILSETKITGAGLALIGGLAQLKTLGLPDSAVDDAGAAFLAKLPALESLSLSNTKVDDAGVATLAKIAGLRSLDLSGTTVTPAGLAALRELKQLRNLRVIGMKADAAAMSALRKSLPGVQITKSERAGMIAAARFEAGDAEAPDGQSDSTGDQAGLPAGDGEDELVELRDAVQAIRTRPQDFTEQQIAVLARRLEESVDADPKPATRLSLLAELRERQGRVDDGIAIYRRILKLPDVSESMRALSENNLAYALAVRGKASDMAEAEKHINSAVTFFGPLSDLLDTRGVVFLAKGDVTRARADITASIADQPSAAKYFHLALVEEKTDDEKAMKEAFAKALSLKLDASQVTVGERAALKRLQDKTGWKPSTEKQSNQPERQGEERQKDGEKRPLIFTVTPQNEAAVDGDAPSAESSAAAKEGAGAKPADGTPLARLRALGANIYELGKPRADSLGIYLGREWKGTDADLEMLNDLRDVQLLTIELSAVNPAALGKMKLGDRLQSLILSPVSDESIAKITSLPAADTITLGNCTLSAAGCQHLAPLATGATGLQIQGVRGSRNANELPQAVPDAGLEAISRIGSLQKLDLFNTAVTDAGVVHLARLAKLESFTLATCPAVRGKGLARLQPLADLRRLQISETSLDAEGLRSLAKLSQLRSLTLHLTDVQPEDVTPLQGLVNLRALTVMRFVPPQDATVSTDLGDAVLRATGTMTALEGLALQSVAASDAGVAELNPAAKLRVITLEVASINDAILASVARFATLRRLTLAGKGEYTAIGLENLAALAQLKQLVLSGEPVTDEMLSRLAGLSALESLTLTHGKFNGSGLTALAPLKHLTTLNIGFGAMNDDGTRALLALPGLESLNLDSTKVTNAALDPISRLTKLIILSLSNTRITGAGLDKLKTLAKLQSITLRGDNISKEAKAKFTAAHPGVNIEDGGAWLTFQSDAYHALTELDGDEP